MRDYTDSDVVASTYLWIIEGLPVGLYDCVLLNWINCGVTGIHDTKSTEPDLILFVIVAPQGIFSFANKIHLNSSAGNAMPFLANNHKSLTL